MSDLPKVVRLYLRTSIIGFLLAGVWVALLLYGNVANLGYLVLNSPDWAIALFMLWFFNGIIFAGVQFAWTLMSESRRNDDDDDDDDSGGYGGRMTQDRIAIPVRVDPPRRRY